MFIVFGKVFAIFIMIFIGFLANKIKILSNEAIPHITNLMLYVTAPCMAISSIYSKTLSADVIVATVQTMAGAVIFFTVTTLFSILIVKLFKFKPGEDRGMYIVAITTVNSGFMGFPVTKAIFGGDIFYLMVMHNILLNLYMYGAVPPLLNIGSETKLHPKKILKSMCNICVIAVIAGIIMLILGVKPPAVLDDVIQSLSDATIPLSMLLVGMQLGSSNVKDILRNKYILLTTITAMLVIPAITFLIVDQMDFLYTDVKAVMVFASAFPTAVAPVAIAEQEGKNSHTLAEIVSLTTFTSLITIPVIAVFLMSYYY